MSLGALRGLLAAALDDPFFGSLRSATGSITRAITGPSSIRPFVAAALADGFAESGGSRGVPVLLVTATGREAEAAAASIGDLIGAHAEAEIELRVTPSLWPLRDAAVDGAFDFSIVRLHNAQPRPGS